VIGSVHVPHHCRSARRAFAARGAFAMRARPVNSEPSAKSPRAKGRCNRRQLVARKGASGSGEVVHSTREELTNASKKGFTKRRVSAFQSLYYFLHVFPCLCSRDLQSAQIRGRESFQLKIVAPECH
jgi:hypothetical protein